MKIIHFLYLPSVFAFVFTSSFTFADRLSKTHPYYPENFYSEVNSGLEDDDLRDELFKILSSCHIPSTSGPDSLASTCDDQSSCYEHTSISYNEARAFVLGHLDLREQAGKYSLKDVYCQEVYTTDDFPSGEGPGPGKIPDHHVFNVEHTWPQSRFSEKFSKSFQKSDLHILYGASQKANNSRGNIEFADVQIDQDPICSPVRRGWVRGNIKDAFFEPPDEHKGNVARAIFYFAVRYKLPVSEIEEESLKRWHRLDPIDSDEHDRHEEIFKVQKVRNPFVDHPELVDLISDF